MLLLNPFPALSDYRLLALICTRSTHKLCRGASFFNVHETRNSSPVDMTSILREDIFALYVVRKR